MTHTPFGTCWWSGAAEIRKTQGRTAQYTLSSGLFWHKRPSGSPRQSTPTIQTAKQMLGLQGEVAELFVPQLPME